MEEGNTLKIFAVTICNYSVKKASLDEITLVIAVCPPLPLLAYDHRVLWVRELHIWTLQHGNWLSQSALFWHTLKKCRRNSEHYPLPHPRTWLGQITLVIAANLTIWHQAIWCSGSQNCKFGPYNMEIGCSCLNQIDADEQPK